MKKIDNFTNLYKVTKTLKFKLIPVGKTEENFNNAKLLEIDEKRAENYIKAKMIIDKYFVSFIERNLSEVKSKKFIALLKKFNDLYFKKDKTDKEKDELKNQITKELRKEIVNCFEQDRAYDILFKGKEILEAILNDKNINEEEYNIISSFDKFSTYFSNFLTNRKNMFSEEEKVGTIAYRLIHENLPMFLSNINAFEKIKKELSTEIKELNKNIKDLSYGCKIEDIFTIDYYSICLSGLEISKYNAIIGGKSLENGEKVKGINEYINLYNQKIAVFNKEHKENKKQKLPLLKQLYKQILQEGEKISFVIDSIDTKEQVYEAIDKYLKNDEYKFIEIFNKLIECIKNINEYNLQKIYIDNKLITNVSQKIYGNYNIINMCFEKDYIDTHEKEKGKKKYEENLKKNLKSLKYSIGKIIEVTNKYYNEEKIEFCKNINDIIIQLKVEFDKCLIEYTKISKIKPEIRGKEKNIEIIKKLLDSIKNIYDYFSVFIIKDLDVDLDEYFYADLSNLQKIEGIIHLYNIVRNYVTKKPYSTDKIKLNFENPTFLNGWDVNKESDNSGVLLIKDGLYYLGIMNKNSNKIFKEAPISKTEKNSYCKINYKLLPGPNKMLPKVFLSTKGIETYNPSKELIKKYNAGTHKKGENFRVKDMQILIDYFKDCINKHEDYSLFKFKYTNTNKYEDLSQFYREVEHQGYKITYINISDEYINEKIENGELYLYQIYNKDFSKYSHKNGNKNLHTLYFEQLFDEENLKDVVYKLNGEAEVFYRKKSIEYKVTHPKNTELENKNPLNKNKSSKFKYDLIKDKRFAFDQMELHIPITINFKSEDNLYDNAVNNEIKKCKDNYIIGIDRGERNLIYVVVINERGEIIEQISFNEIVNNYNNQEYKTDYHNLLDKKEVDRDKSRKNWTTIENIKELKEGYISQVVHKICELVEKYDAIIVMEDLNSGFKRGRIKVEKQVYQKFEKMLIDKLNLYVNKNKKPDEMGGLRKAYQLTRPYEGNAKMHFQNGIIYYIAPWNTSKIDPTTGFVNLFRFSNYNSVNDRKKFFEKMDDIRYNEKEKYFEFKFNYNNFENTDSDYKKEWIVCTVGGRIKTFRNEKKNNQRDTEEVMLNDEYIKLFDKNDIDYKQNIKEQILNKNDKVFFDNLFFLFKLTLQMRNTKPDTDIDYLISPVKNGKGLFYNSIVSKKNNEKLPFDADANGAYNIARKGLMIVKRIKEGVEKKLTVISNSEWLEFAQNQK